MITIEQFYFNYKEASSHITAGSDGTDFYIEFHGAEGPSLCVTMRGRDDFRRLISHIHDMGIGLVHVSEESEARRQLDQGATVGAVATPVEAGKAEPSRKGHL
jgi:hypothetical protein